MIFGGALVFFMQAGFALVETGFCRAKNAVHVIMTNFVIFAIGVHRLLGGRLRASVRRRRHHRLVGRYAAPAGMLEIAKGWGLFGHQGFFLAGGAYDVVIIAFFFFQLVFMDTAATIPTGAMAERWKFSAFVVYGVFMAAIVYPIYGNWVWGGGWLVGSGPQRRPRPRRAGLRRLGRGARGRRLRGPGRRDRPRAPASASSTRTASRGAILGHNIPMAILGYDLPGVRLDRLQRRLHAGGRRTCASPSSSSTRSSPPPPVPARRCSWCGSSGESPTRR